MSAEFDDLVARVRAVAMDEARAALTDATYPTAEQITAAHVDLVGRLWAAVVGGAVGGPYQAPSSLPYYCMEVPALTSLTGSPDGADAFAHTFALPSGGAYRSALRPGEVVFMGIDLASGEDRTVRDYVETVGDHLRASGQGYPKPDGIQPRNPGDVPMTPRDPIHDAIDANNKPGRANE